MDVLIDGRGQILDGFWVTVQVILASGLIATVLGTALASMRVAPVRALNAIGTSYVNVFRNTPLLLVFMFIYFGLPELEIIPPAFWRATLALSLYTAAFVCEALRSGINAVQAGQAEAARSIGMTFTQSLRIVVMPQAFRAVIPPLASVYIAMTKNSSLVAIFGLSDATKIMKGLLNNNPGSWFWLFFGIALGYVIIVELISLGAHLMERRVAASR